MGFNSGFKGLTYQPELIRDILVRSQNFEMRLLASSCLSVFPSVCPHKTTRLPPDGYLLNLILEYYPTICRENSGFTTIGQEQTIRYMKSHTYFIIISRSFVLRIRNISDKSCRANQNIHFVFGNLPPPPPPENRAGYEKM